MLELRMDLAVQGVPGQRGSKKTKRPPPALKSGGFYNVVIIPLGNEFDRTHYPN